VEAPPRLGQIRPAPVTEESVTGEQAGHLVADLLPSLRAFAIPMRTRFRGITVREGALIEGPGGWGEFSPFPEYGPRECARWLACALEAATSGWPPPVRAEVPVNVTVPAVGPEQAHAIVTGSGGGIGEGIVAVAVEEERENLLLRD
jgi:O-succinylbenzoate synthase